MEHTQDVIKVSLAVELGESARKEISDIFVEGFFQWLQFFSKDKATLKAAFAHMFNLDVFYIALAADKIVGIAACTNGTVPSVRLQKNELTRHLGFLRGRIAYSVLKKEFEEKQYPFSIPSGMGMVEFVATAPGYRGKGVAMSIIRHIFDATPYAEYALEVADANTNAVRLYEKLGFSEFLRIPQKHGKRSGVNNLVYMKTENRK
ncbi:GNAT family N-acetyltransferase [Christensenellaceae bacterium OttesenSCG-928-M15]|nr:GNAT family N-acetyltransferase [Christensenellaceae bacterium OttesenSCG-928-M15]